MIKNNKEKVEKSGPDSEWNTLLQLYPDIGSNKFLLLVKHIKIQFHYHFKEKMEESDFEKFLDGFSPQFPDFGNNKFLLIVNHNIFKY